MTKQGSFKRAVRQRASETGERYTEARAALEQAKAPEAPTPARPYELSALRAHLADHYGTPMTSLAPSASTASRSSTSTPPADATPAGTRRSTPTREPAPATPT